MHALRLACLLAALPLTAAADDRPNILLFLTDDESWQERSAYGWSNLPTPHFDRVAREGVLMTNAYSSAPSCAPARAALLTGRNFWELKQGAFIQAWLPKEFPTFPQLLADRGYAVGRSGKGWGPGITPPRGYDFDVAGLERDRQTMQPPPPTDIAPTDYAGNFDRFLKRRQPRQPFFFWAGLKEPHGPYNKQNHRRLAKLGVALDRVPVPDTVENTPAMREARANFLYEICYADQHLGRMLASLEAAGELDNTLVIVTADNGTAIAQGKASPYDWGTHVPMAMMWPSHVPAGRTVTDFVSFADVAPTLLAATHIDTPESLSGRSFLNVLESQRSGRVDPQRDHVVTGLEWHGELDPESNSSRTIRDDRFELIFRYPNVDAAGQVIRDDDRLTQPTRIEFYDLSRDPWQQTDLADDPAFNSERNRLTTMLRRSGKQTGDPRFTGDMQTFRETRQFVQERKRGDYKTDVPIPDAAD